MAGTRAARRLVLGGLAAIAMVALSGCSVADLPRYGWPQSASVQGEKMQFLWSGMFTAALVVGAIVWGLMFWCFIVYRKRRNSPLYPKQTRENLPVELVYTAIPFILVAAIFYTGATVQNEVLKMNPNPDVVVNVTAFKWNWDFAYEGSTTPSGGLIHTIGTSEEVPVLILPNNKTVEYVLDSKDVVHSFWVPAFDFKRDVFPFPEANNSDNRFQTTLKREGAWVGHCAELCGTYHAAMNFEVRSVPDDIYAAYIKARETGLSNSAALTKVGNDFPNCKALCSSTSTTTYPLQTNRTAKAATPIPEGVVGLTNGK
ncbi:MAG: cytochrome c oxidase subunit II [Nakamurella sp.]